MGVRGAPADRRVRRLRARARRRSAASRSTRRARVCAPRGRPRSTCASGLDAVRARRARSRLRCSPPPAPSTRPRSRPPKRSARTASRCCGAGTRVLTHCNAGWLAVQDWGTALAPVYKAGARRARAVRVGERDAAATPGRAPHRVGAGARKACAHALIADGAAAHLIQRGEVDLVLTGADRIAANGDTANKIGTYGHALAARAHGVPFYVAAPRTTIDPAVDDRRRHPDRGARSRRGARRSKAWTRRGERRACASSPPGTRARQPRVRRHTARADRRDRHRGRDRAGDPRGIAEALRRPAPRT